MNGYLESGRKILRLLNENGYQAYFVGGFVRDFLLGIPSADIDIATAATPDEVTGLFPGTKATGVKYGTVTVFIDGFGFETTTFRCDGGYQDSRHPETVAFTDSLAHDLERRDFTVNAMAMDADGQIYDHFGGQQDLTNKLLRAIGVAQKRFEEDALRILRAFRFVAKLDFDIEPDTFASLYACRHLIANIANERVLNEMKYIVRSPYATKAYRLMTLSGILEAIPALKKGVTFLAGGDAVTLTVDQFYALCFHLNGGDVPEEWRFSNRERQKIERIVTLVEVTAEDEFDELLVYVNGLELCLAANAVRVALDPTRDRGALIRHLDAALPIHKTCELAFKGDDILKLTKLRDARLIGDVIDELTHQVITGRLPNEREPLQAFARARLREMGVDDDGE
ncbi:MAG: CCA tRNA nucleotidyltransferase [bacterium]